MHNRPEGYAFPVDKEVKKMKKLVKRNVVKKDTVELYASCFADCLSCTCTYVAARDDNHICRYDLKYTNHAPK